ncbi:Pentatricopeptide repeat-containing protein [Apostasia shenzhenica]|uniref:Pentatricopeptide repeat-containing protein n=1 Tax=Apostasia shenzhenica TaxID=1088818 RepID=A0A2I0AKR1_9ASPA|nr:Pentatricopeptide repeat-containing protein [Apostasia shenzhenica]
MGQKNLRLYPLMQIFLWMASQSNFQASPPVDHATVLDLIVKVDGLAKAELYFDQISTNASKKSACLPLLHAYVKARELEKAEKLLAMLGNLGLIANPHPFNEIMKLYMAISQFEKTIYVIQFMKRKKIPLNVLSYNLWMNACGKLADVASLEMVYKEMRADKNVEVGWSTYCTLAHIYTRLGLFNKAFTSLRIAEGKLSLRKRLGYSFIITLYAALGDKDGVLRLWESSKRVAGKIPCACYMSVISCLIKLEEILEAERVFRDWEFQCRNYDIRVPNILLGVYVRNGWIEQAESLFCHTLAKGATPNYKTWEILMEGWVKNKQMGMAVEAMKKGFSLLENCIWRPPSEIVLAIAEYYELHLDVEESRRYVAVLRRFGLMNLHLYKSFVRLHRKAMCETPSILRMMAEDGIEPDEELRLLLNHSKTSSIEDISVD